MKDNNAKRIEGQFGTITTQYERNCITINKKDRIILITTQNIIIKGMEIVTLNPNLLGGIDNTMKIAHRMRPDHIMVVM